MCRASSAASKPDAAEKPAGGGASKVRRSVKRSCRQAGSSAPLGAVSSMAKPSKVRCVGPVESWGLAL